MNLFKKLEKGIKRGEKKIEQGVKVVSGQVDGAVGTLWHASSNEANEITNAIESVGTVVSPGMIEGSKYALSWTEQGAVIAYKSAVDAGKYVTQHACDIAVGSALSSVFVTFAANGEEEESLGALAATCAASTINRAIIATQSDALAAILSDVIWLCPGISFDKKMTKDILRSILAFIIQKCCTEKANLVVGTAGQYIVGAIIACVTTLICEGALPGGYKL